MYVVGTQNDRLDETVLLSTQNLCYEEYMYVLQSLRIVFHLGLHCLPKHPFRGFQYKGSKGGTCICRMNTGLDKQKISA